MNPKVEICVFYDRKRIHIECELAEDDCVKTRKAMPDAYYELREMHDENDGNTQVFYVKNAVATISSFTDAHIYDLFIGKDSTNIRNIFRILVVVPAGTFGN